MRTSFICQYSLWSHVTDIEVHTGDITHAAHVETHDTEAYIMHLRPRPAHTHNRLTEIIGFNTSFSHQ